MASASANIKRRQIKHNYHQPVKEFYIDERKNLTKYFLSQNWDHLKRNQLNKKILYLLREKYAS